MTSPDLALSFVGREVIKGLLVTDPRGIFGLLGLGRRRLGTAPKL